jgi:NADPH-dependent 2,4-dienoyl-CoA reductase/sulfur reductase-like enzyme
MSEPDEEQPCDVLVIGAGPAGLAAASEVARAGRRATLVDDNPAAGGQIWRAAGESREALSHPAIEFIGQTQVCALQADGALLAESPSGSRILRYRTLILATGARERFLPFPGWTLPNVMGAGGLQALVKSGLEIAGRRVVVAGSGPLLLAVAAYLKSRDARVLLIAEQASPARLADFGLALAGARDKARQAISFAIRLAAVPYRAGCWVEAAEGEGRLSSVTLRRGKRQRKVECDYLACGFHLRPNLETALLLGCEATRDGVRVDEYQATTVPGIYAAGEATGIGGLELSLVEGRIAGLAAADRQTEARLLFAARERAQRFAARLNRAFALRDELKALPQAETIVCRCEDVAYGRLREQGSWRAAKLQTRCGMGPCQGRVCGGALEFLRGWEVDSFRPPAIPCRLGSLAGI